MGEELETNYDGIKLLFGDCHALLPQLKEEAALFLTDPPYGINYQNNFTHRKHQRLLGDDSPFSYRLWGMEAMRLLRVTGTLFAYTCWTEYPQHFMDLKTCGFQMREPLVVQKRASGTTDLYGSFQTNSDWLLFASKGSFKFRPTQLLRNKRAGTVPNKGRRPVAEFKTRFPSSWFGDEFPYSTANPATVKQWRHPTIKNIKFLEWIILLTTDPGDLVIDPFVGSGSTLIAAYNTGRRAIGMELDSTFYQIAVKRLNSVFNNGETNG